MSVGRPVGYICLAVYRPDEVLLARQIGSLRGQTDTDWRCLVGIDGVDDLARSAVEAVVAGDDRFVVREYRENIGFYRNFERLLREVPPEAAWVALSDQDDEWFSHKLETLVPHLRAASLVMGQAIVTRADGEGPQTLTRRRAVSLIAELIDNQVTGSACIVRRDLLDRALPFPQPTDLAFHDHWLGACAIVADGITVIDEPLQYYLQHDANVIGEERRDGLWTRVRALFNRSGGGVNSALSYLSRHRWGWRVNMASALKLGELRAEDAWVVDLFARGRISLRLVWSALAVVLRRDAPWSRAVGLMLGSAMGRKGSMHRS